MAPELHSNWEKKTAKLVLLVFKCMLFRQSVKIFSCVVIERLNYSFVAGLVMYQIFKMFFFNK